MFEKIKQWFLGLWKQPSVKSLARIAATLIVSNNKTKALEILVFLKAALVMAKGGKLTNELFLNTMNKIATTYQNKEILAAMSAFISIPDIKVGTVNQDVIDILETLISVIEAA